MELERGRLTQHVENSVAYARNAALLAESAGSHALVIRARLLEASRYAGKGDLPQSEEMVRLAVSLAEKSHLGAVAAEGLIDLSEVIFAQVKYEEAARLLEQARGIAQRFSAKRTEAEVLLRLGRVLARINDTERRQQARAALDEAEKFFQSSGAKASLVRTLRARGDLYRFEGKLGEARLQHERAARESETDHDRTLSRIALAQVSMLQGNYLAVAKLQRENADYYRRAGNKLLGQRYQLDHAHALRLAGRWEEAESALRVVVDEGPGPEFVDRCEVDQAAIDFGRRRLDRALGRLEQNLAKIDPKEKKAHYERRRYDLCMKYASAGWTAKAENLCTEIAPIERPSPRRYLDVLDALAMVSLQKHDYPRAARLARESLELSAAGKMTESHFFTLMLLTRALHGAGDAEWRAARERTRDALRQWEKESGEDVVRQSLTRWFIAEHWNAVQQFE
ncbi:MAG: hypothetical protein JNL62_19005 [Bryobacterales bacterium]|nr:hypothetical protein [Bryobacterales bacterium]